MWKNRIIMLSFIILTAVFASFFGGPLPYALFYLSLSIPLASYLYLLYIYYRFRVYQYLDKKTLVKYESVPFRFVLANEDYITYSHIRVTFLSDYSTLEQIHITDSHTLLPEEREEFETTLTCRYSGIYHVGIDQILLEDTLRLFRLSYRCPTPMEVHVLPRILQPERLSFLEALTEGVRLTDNQSSQFPDAETRRYQLGDSPRRIHWKALAHHGALMTRKTLPEPKPQMHVFLDLDLPASKLSEYLPRFDVLAETTLAITDFYLRAKTPCEVYADCKGFQHFPVHSQNEFELLYAFFCQNEHLKGSSLVTLLEHFPGKDITNTKCILITTRPSIELVRVTTPLLDAGNTITILCLCKEDLSAFHAFTSERFLVLSIDPDKDLTASLERI